MNIQNIGNILVTYRMLFDKADMISLYRLISENDDDFSQELKDHMLFTTDGYIREWAK